MPTQPKGDFEVIYGGPWGGIDYSRPYNTIDKNNLAPGSVNTSQMSGYLTSSPAIAASPYSTLFAPGEILIGAFEYSLGLAGFGSAVYGSPRTILFVTNVAVYTSGVPGAGGGQLTKAALTNVHSWNPVTEFSPLFYSNGSTIAFVQINDARGAPTPFPTVYFTGAMLKGVFAYNLQVGFQTATTYVAGAYMVELNQRLVIGEAIFPTGGGPVGNFIEPVIAWSGVGSYIGAGITDPWNPANFATLGGNIGGFNLLTDTPDQVTGLATEGRSALIARDNGLSQMDPGPSGIDPWLFYHLWASETGQGAFPNTLQQYGEYMLMLSVDNVYQLSLQGGIQPVGNQVISDIIRRRVAAGLQGGTSQVIGNPGQWAINFWYFASIVVISGQMHYLLSFNTMTEPLPSTVTQFSCIVYDYNVNEGAWHVWDMSQYFGSSAQGAGFNVMSSPITQLSDSINGNDSLGTNVGLTLPYLLFGGETNATSGQMFNFVPFDYDATNNPYGNFVALIYQPTALPKTTMTFRGEIVSLGHKISVRRLRIQAMQAPTVGVVSNQDMQAIVSFTGSQSGPVTGISFAMPPTLLMVTYYGDVYLKDEMIQASITGLVPSPQVNWGLLPMFRISTVSFIGDDEQGQTQ